MGIVHAKDSQTPGQSPRFNLECVKARVDKVRIEGLGRTKDDLLTNKVQELFKAQDFQEVILGAHKVRSKLESLECFSKVGILIDTSDGPDATPDGLEVIFQVKELKRITGSVKTLMGNNEGSLVVELRAPNMFGRGEKLTAEYSRGWSRTVGLSTTFYKPLAVLQNAGFSASLFQQGSEWIPSGYKLIERGLLLDLAFNSKPSLRHNIQWEGSWRELECLTRSTSFLVREQSGHSLKSAFRHIAVSDTRDAAVFPSTGTLFKVIQEVAGIGGDIGFLKNEVHYQHNRSLASDVVLQSAFQFGMLNTLSNHKTAKICDRFYLGGPLSLRGFEWRGVGPHDQGNSLGGEVFWAGGLHLFSPLPFRPGGGGFGDLFRTHVFVNAGNIAASSTDIKDYFQNLRLAYGIGIALRLGQIARVELNYCVPVLAQKSDHVSSGVQVGVGLSFL
ncbi:sorting and assembly machinery component 50 homolog B [Ischnura elegans]|uniref:sorting and assembly machinery component 50 homolog B n=1 Tax=Ischnura elegans TaxID=197161 RepID=UPI001ED8675C|nr:sorting and assembly machinery component 50 homolog B [Ischnura elegans]